MNVSRLSKDRLRMMSNHNDISSLRKCSSESINSVQTIVSELVSPSQQSYCLHDRKQVKKMNRYQSVCQLIVTLQYGVNLPIKDPGELFIAFSINKQVFHSSRTKNPNPTFNQVFTFTVIRPFNETLEITLNHSDGKKNVEIQGTIRLAVIDYFNKKESTTSTHSFENGGQVAIVFTPVTPLCTMDGMLTKEGSVLKTWKRRYFVLKEGVLAYYQNKMAKTPIRSFSIVNISVIVSSRPSYMIQLVNPNSNFNKNFKILADSESDYLKWVDALILEGGIKKTVDAFPKQYAIPSSLIESSADAYDTLSPQEKVYAKLNKNIAYYRGKNCQRLAYMLSSKEELKKSYLSVDAKNVTTLLSMLPSEEIPPEEREEEVYIVASEEHLAAEVPMKSMAKKVKVKLVITELAPNTKHLRYFLSPVLCAIPSGSHDFGLFHTALIVGPWLLEWNRSALVIPRRMSSQMAFISADIGDLVITNNSLEEIVDKIADCVVDWNVNYKYVKTNYSAHLDDSKTFAGNCQDFVDAMLKTLDISVRFDGPLAEFLNNIRCTGRADMTFNCKDLASKFPFIEKPSRTFTTHKELDVFVTAIIEEEALFETEYKNEYLLLKSFDRAFWLRFIRKATPEVRPLECMGDGTIECRCPFGNPFETGSYI